MGLQSRPQHIDLTTKNTRGFMEIIDTPETSKEIELEHSHQMDQIFGAMAAAQGAMSAAAKDSTNPFFNSKYADLSSVWNACRDSLSKNNICVIQTTKAHDDRLHLVTLLGHSSGQWIKGTIEIKVRIPESEVDKYGKLKKINELQLLGSYFTYLRRYCLSAMVGVAPDEDDDGNKGQRKEPVVETLAHQEPWKLEAKLLSKKKIDEALAKFPDREMVDEYLTYLVKSFDLTYKEWVYKMVEKTDDFNKNFVEWEQKNRSALSKEKSA